MLTHVLLVRCDNSREREGLTQDRLSLKVNLSQKWTRLVKDGVVEPETLPSSEVLIATGPVIHTATPPVTGTHLDVGTAIDTAQHEQLVLLDGLASQSRPGQLLLGAGKCGNVGASATAATRLLAPDAPPPASLRPAPATLRVCSFCST